MTDTLTQRLRKELAECRDHLSAVIAQPDRPTIKKAADWLADWDGVRIDPSADESDVEGKQPDGL